MLPQNLNKSSEKFLSITSLLQNVSLSLSSVAESFMLLATVLVEDSVPLSDQTLSCKLRFPSAHKWYKVPLPLCHPSKTKPKGVNWRRSLVWQDSASLSSGRMNVRVISYLFLLDTRKKTSIAFSTKRTRIAVSVKDLEGKAEVFVHLLPFSPFLTNLFWPEKKSH